MTPKEKAEELVGKNYKLWKPLEVHAITPKRAKERAKRSAIIVCNEVIDSEHLSPFTKRTRNILMYWQEVKRIIEEEL